MSHNFAMRNGQRTWPHFGLVSGTHHAVGYTHSPLRSIIPEPSSVEQELGSKLLEVHGFGTDAQQNTHFLTVQYGNPLTLICYWQLAQDNRELMETLPIHTYHNDKENTIQQITGHWPMFFIRVFNNTLYLKSRMLVQTKSSMFMQQDTICLSSFQ